MKSTRTREKLSAALPLSAALVACLGGCGDEAGPALSDGGVQDLSATLKPPSGVPALLQPPAGATVTVLFHGRGDQVYVCTAMMAGGTDGGATTYGWVLKAPDAKLYDDAGRLAGTHYAGPTWAANDQSTVVGMRVQQVNAPQSDAITWLLLKAISHTGSGLLAPITFIQRLYTQGGVAPAGGCDVGNLGAELRQPYSADYYFYAGGG